VVMIEPAGIKTEIVASTTRKVERVRVFPPVANEAESD